MRNFGPLVTRRFARLGQPATITWPNKALDAAQDESLLNTHVVIEDKGNALAGDGKKVARVSVLLPVTTREIVGATLTTGGKSFKITSSQTIAQALQRAVLS
jgi:hypothetical protein